MPAALPGGDGRAGRDWWGRGPLGACCCCWYLPSLSLKKVCEGGACPAGEGRKGSGMPPAPRGAPVPPPMPLEPPLNELWRGAPEGLMPGGGSEEAGEPAAGNAGLGSCNSEGEGGVGTRA